MNLGPCAICRKKIFFDNKKGVNIKNQNKFRFSSKNNKKKADIWQISKNRGFFHIDCNNCHSSIFAMNIAGPYPIANKFFSMVIQVPTDLDKEDLKKIHNNDYISADEVLEIIKTLN